MDKTSPFCSTKLVSQRHWAYNYYFLKDEPSSYRQKSPLLSELEFDVLTTVFVPRLRGKSSAGGGKRDLIIELHCDFAHIAGCCNQITSVSDFLPSPPSSSSFSFLFSFFFFFSPSPFFPFGGPNWLLMFGCCRDELLFAFTEDLDQRNNVSKEPRQLFAEGRQRFPAPAETPGAVPGTRIPPSQGSLPFPPPK